jgi:hypothetical protein
MTTDVVPILRVSDAAAAAAWYRRLGFEQVFEHRFEPHLPAYVGLRCDGAQIHLSEHAGDANQRGLLYLWVDDVDAVASEFAVTVEEQPWAREVQLVDLDGNRLRVAQPVGAVSADDVLGSGATQTLIALERAMWTDATRRGPSWMDEHLADSFTEFGWSGRIYNRADILDLEIGAIEVELVDFDVRPIGAGSALVTYRSIQARGPGNRSSVWVRQNGRWLLGFHQGTPALG